MAAAQPELAAEGVLVQEQIAGGFELLLGIKTDRVFGPVVTLGTGGPQAELIDDVAVRAAPLDAGDVREMVGELRSRAVLEARGWDEAAVIAAGLKLGRLAEDLTGLDVELDVNPLFVRGPGEGVIIADAALVARRSGGA